MSNEATSTTRVHNGKTRITTSNNNNNTSTRSSSSRNKARSKTPHGSTQSDSWLRHVQNDRSLLNNGQWLLTDNGRDRSGWIAGSILMGLIVVVFGVVLGLNSWLATNTAHVDTETAIRRGTYGDQYGFASAIFSFISSVGVVVALLLQWRELSQQRDVLRSSARTEQMNMTLNLFKEWHEPQMLEDRLRAQEYLNRNERRVRSLRNLERTAVLRVDRSMSEQDARIVRAWKKDVKAVLRIYHFYERIVLLAELRSVDVITLQTLLREYSGYWCTNLFVPIRKVERNSLKDDPDDVDKQQLVNMVERICMFCKILSNEHDDNDSDDGDSIDDDDDSDVDDDDSDVDGNAHARHGSEQDALSSEIIDDTSRIGSGNITHPAIGQPTGFGTISLRNWLQQPYPPEETLSINEPVVYSTTTGSRARNGPSVPSRQQTDSSGYSTSVGTHTVASSSIASTFPGVPPAHGPSRESTLDSIRTHDEAIRMQRDTRDGRQGGLHPGLDRHEAVPGTTRPPLPPPPTTTTTTTRTATGTGTATGTLSQVHETPDQTMSSPLVHPERDSVQEKV